MRVEPIQEARIEYKGFPIVVLFGNLGFRCGYVGIRKERAYYKVRYEDIDVCCHGGLTYGRPHLYGQEDEHTWWIGFDCGHYDDDVDLDSTKKYFNDLATIDYVTNFKNLYRGTGYKAWTLEDVLSECKDIVDQLVAQEEQCMED